MAESYYGRTQYHHCKKAEGDNGKMLSKALCRQYYVEYFPSVCVAESEASK
jgi:hypothetical protein